MRAANARWNLYSILTDVPRGIDKKDNNMKPTSKTALFCCGARMVDAESVKPVCGDHYAQVFMDQESLEVVEIFKAFKNAQISNVTRHRIIDDLVKQEIDNDPGKTIILMGSGFDTRAYRFHGGTWVEFDDPQLIKYKNNRLPISQCNNSLKRIPYDYEKDSLAEKLAGSKTKKEVVIIIEGVFIYLEEDATKKLLEALQSAFPKHVLLCDLQTVSFFNTFNKKFQNVLCRLGSPLKIVSDVPEQVFLKAGYKIKERIPILDKTLEYAKLSLSQIFVKFALKTIFKKVKDGYSIYAFKMQ